MDDIINSEDKLITMRDLKKYNINVNILNYYTMKAKLERFMSKFRLLGSSTLERHTYPFPLDVLFKSKNGCRHYYNIFNNTEAQKENPTLR